jgi:predicted DNA-binding transcriptional regulator AlpA
VNLFAGKGVNMDLVLKKKGTGETVIIEDEPWTIDDVRVLTQVDLSGVLGLSVTTIRRLRKDPASEFPPQRNFGATVKGWLYEEIKEWARSRPAA